MAGGFRSARGGAGTTTGAGAKARAAAAQGLPAEGLRGAGGVGAGGVSLYEAPPRGEVALEELVSDFKQPIQPRRAGAGRRGRGGVRRSTGSPPLSRRPRPAPHRGRRCPPTALPPGPPETKPPGGVC